MEMLTIGFLGKPLWAWLTFVALVLVLLAVDLGLFHRKSHEIGIRESLLLSGFYITLGLVFGGWIWLQHGAAAGIDYWTGFLIEKSLALDNIFVIALIFSYLGVPRAYQHRVLVLGVLGVIVLRGIMIGAGAALVAEFAWVLLVFAAFLVFTGVKMLLIRDEGFDVGANPLFRFLKKRLRVTETLEGERFFVRRPDPDTGRPVRHATPLFLALVMVEAADVVFAVDSVPAIFAITQDPYIVYTSNIFAILGLRALYFALAAMIHRFASLKQALALVLIFIGGKIVAADLLGIDKIPAAVSLAVTVVLIAGGIGVSLWKTRGDKRLRQAAGGVRD